MAKPKSKKKARQKIARTVKAKPAMPEKIKTRTLGIKTAVCLVLSIIAVFLHNWFSKFYGEFSIIASTFFIIAIVLVVLTLIFFIFWIIFSVKASVKK